MITWNLEGQKTLSFIISLSPVQKRLQERRWLLDSKEESLLCFERMCDSRDFYMSYEVSDTVSFKRFRLGGSLLAEGTLEFARNPRFHELPGVWARGMDAIGTVWVFWRSDEPSGDDNAPVMNPEVHQIYYDLGNDRLESRAQRKLPSRR